jgi:phosphocarrier protein FPr/phosphocarrier protein
VQAVAKRLKATDNPLIQERAEDFDDLERQFLRGLGNADAAPAIDLPERAILLAAELLPSELMALDKKRLAGLCLSRSGPTSHAAIIAASLAVPTLVAMGPGLDGIADGASLLLDSAAGQLIVDPDPELAAQIASSQPAALVTGDCTTADGERIVLLANLGSVDEAGPAVAAGAEGCGLLRTEFLFLDRSTPPDEDEQSRTYQAIADALGPRPLTIRTLDIGGDKPVAYLPLPSEENPALGVRGIRTGLLRPELLDQQLRGILKVRSAARPRIMLPMISSIAELRAVRSRLDALDPGGDVALGIMIETPAAAVLAGDLAAEADFFSIGSNDLTQYALAMDRANPLLAAQVDALHPAVLRLIAMTVEGAAKNGKPVAVCGGLASDPLGARILVGLGIRELSAVPAAIGAIKASLRSVTLERCRALALQALEADSAAGVRHLAAQLTPASGDA